MILVLERLGRKYFIKVGENEKSSSIDYYYETTYTTKKSVWIIGPDTAKSIIYSSTDKSEIKKKCYVTLIGKYPNYSDDFWCAYNYFEEDVYTGIDIHIPEYILMSDQFSDIEKARCIVYANQFYYKVVKYSENTSSEFEDFFEKNMRLIGIFGQRVYREKSMSKLNEQIFDEQFQEYVVEINKCLEKYSPQNSLYTSVQYKDRAPFYFVLNKKEKRTTDIADILSDFFPKNSFEELNYLCSYVFPHNCFIGLNSYQDLRDLLWNEEISCHLARDEEANMKRLKKLIDWKNAIQKWKEEYDDYSSPGIEDDFLGNIGLREQMEILPLKEFEDYWKPVLYQTDSVKVGFCTHQRRLSETMSQLVLGGTLDDNDTYLISRTDVICCNKILKKWEFIRIVNNIWQYDFSEMSDYDGNKLFFIHQSNREAGFIIDDRYEVRRIAFALNIFS